MSRPTLLCLASYFKGVDFLREAATHAHTLLLTRERTRSDAWPYDALVACEFLPNDASDQVVIEVVAQWARRQPLDRVVALEEYDVMRAALLRDHFAVPGMGADAARRFRDKLAMRRAAAAAGVRVPAFTRLVHETEIDGYLHSTQPPWVLKPRFDVSAMGVQILHDQERVWGALEALDGRDAPSERTSYFLLEQFVAGDVYHVDSVVFGRDVIFAGVNRYGRPPFDVAHRGGVFVTATVPRGSADEQALLSANEAVLRALGHERGVAHAEFIKDSGGRFYFLEVAARVGGAYIAETLEAASGVNLWREWARLEGSIGGAGVPAGREQFQILPTRQDHAGIALSLARQEWPDTSAYNHPEIVARIAKRHHVGLIVRAPAHERVAELLDEYVRRFTYDFCAVVPPLERPP